MPGGGKLVHGDSDSSATSCDSSVRRLLYVDGVEAMAMAAEEEAHDLHVEFLLRWEKELRVQGLL